MSPKYDIFNFTESYRHAEKRHTVLLPALMGVVVLFCFWLVVKTRPTVRKNQDVGTLTAPKTSKDKSDRSVSTDYSKPQKIDLNIDFDYDIGSVPVIDPGIDIHPGNTVRTSPVRPVVESDPIKVVRARPVSKDGLPLVDAGIPSSRFTKWMTPIELNKHILALNQGQEVSFWDRGHWIIAVEGRWSSNQQEYRIVYEKTPQDANYHWRYRIAQSKDAYARNIKQLKLEGFTLVQSQFYENPDSSSQYQAVWQKRL